jgi:MFS family permease
MIAGLAASAPMTNVGGTLSDIWSPEEKGLPMAIFSSLIFIGPACGPLIGGYIAVGTTDGFHNIYWVSMIMSQEIHELPSLTLFFVFFQCLFGFTGIVFVLTLFTTETLAPIILEKKAAKLRRETGDPRWHVLHKKPPMMTILKASLVRPFGK